MKRTTLAVLTGALLLTACGDKPQVEQNATPAAGVVTASAPAASEVAVSDVSATEAAVSEAVAEQGPVKAFTAFGSKPKGWRVVVRGEAEETGNRLALEGEDLPEAEIDVTRSAYAKGVEFSGNVGETAVNLNIRTEACTDSEGNKYDSKATLDFGSTVYEGCAVDGAVEHAPT